MDTENNKMPVPPSIEKREFYEEKIVMDYCSRKHCRITPNECKKCTEMCTRAEQKVILDYHENRKTTISVPKSFELSESEQKSAAEFIKKHSEIHNWKSVNPSYTFQTGGGIGIAVMIRCDICGTVEDITDYSTW